MSRHTITDIINCLSCIFFHVMMVFDMCVCVSHVCAHLFMFHLFINDCMFISWIACSIHSRAQEYPAPYSCANISYYMTSLKIKSDSSWHYNVLPVFIYAKHAWKCSPLRNNMQASRGACRLSKGMTIRAFYNGRVDIALVIQLCFTSLRDAMLQLVSKKEHDC